MIAHTRLVRWPITLLAALMLALAACGGGDEKGGGGNATAFATSAPAAAASSSVGRMVLTREQRLMIREQDGKERLVLRAPAGTFPTFPMWSPDGKRIAYVQSVVFTGQMNVDWGGDIYAVDPDGGNQKLLWKHDQTGAQVQGLAWTPDGKGMLFGYFLTIIKDGKFLGQTLRIDRLDLETGKTTPVVDGGQLPSLSTDGRRLAYMTMDATGGGGLWVANADGTDAAQLVQLGTTFIAFLAPRIAPDGSAIAFAAASSQSSLERRPGSAVTSAGAGIHALHGVPMDVFKVMVADRKATRLTRLNEDEPSPAWTPDGAAIVALATGGLYEIAPDGSGAKKIGDGAFGGQVDLR